MDSELDGKGTILTVEPPRRRWPRGFIPLGVIAGLLLALPHVRAPVHRTQEARVLVTAQAMVGQPWRDWLVPHCNGEVRLQKPPLAYWFTAISFTLFGTYDWAGRIPASVLAGLTVALSCLLGRRLFGARAGSFAALVLAGCFLFVKFLGGAETDVYSTFFVTGAGYAFWRAAEAESALFAGPGKAPAAGSLARLGWFHLAGVGVGLAALSKGPPALFPLLLLIALAWTFGRWRLLGEFALSGAWLTALLLIAPWFLYVLTVPQSEVMVRELGVVARGLGHRNPFYYYLPVVLTSTLPFTALVVMALIAAAGQWRADGRVRGLLLWCGIMLVALSLVGQKQPHYLLPLLPPLAILTGWALDRALGLADPTLKRSMGYVLAGMLVAFAVVSAAFPLAAALMRGTWHGGEVAVAGMVATTAAGGLWFWRSSRLEDSLVCALVAGVAGMAAIVPRAEALDPQSIDRRELASRLRSRYGEGPYAFVQSEDLALCFYLRRSIPVLPDNQIPLALERRPQLVLLGYEQANGRAIPAGLIERERYRVHDKWMIIYQGGERAPATRIEHPPSRADR